MNDIAWIDAALTSARPRAVSALLRYFRDLDSAEEAFQNACLKALDTWPRNGPPRDPAAWLIMVGRNVGIDAARRQAKSRPLPDDDSLSDLGDAETAIADRLDESHYRDDILRLLFICCHPELPETQQIALALRIVSGLTVAQIARAFLVGDSAMEQRITRAKTRIAKADVPFETPGAPERAERLVIVARMIYLVFNEGYSATGGELPLRAPLCEEAIRLARLLLRLFQTEPEIMGLLALMLLQHARSAARFDEAGAIILLEEQDRSKWNREMIAEGLALIDKAMRHRRPGPYQVQAAIAALHSRAARPEDTDWAQIDLLYGTLERLTPSPVVTLNRAVAVSKLRGPEAALDMIEPLAGDLSGYFYFFGVKGAMLQQLGRHDEARVAFDRAIALANNAAEAAHIRGQLDRLQKDGARPAKKFEGRVGISPFLFVLETRANQRRCQMCGAPQTPDADRELVLTRLIDAPREKLFRCWTEPELMKQWFAPLPWTVTHAEMNLRPGGSSLIVMKSPEGQEFPNPGIILEVVKNEKIVFTDAYTKAWEPSAKPFMTAIVTFADEGGKTRYTARALHWNAADRKTHEEMGFHEGWGQCADQLAALAKKI